MDIGVILIFVLYCLITALLALGWEDLTKLSHNDVEEYITPASLYRTYKVNYFGAIMLYILWFIASPLSCIISFVAWLCAVGRKD